MKVLGRVDALTFSAPNLAVDELIAVTKVCGRNRKYKVIYEVGYAAMVEWPFFNGRE